MVDDKVIQFGSVTADNFQGLQNIAAIIQHSIGVSRKFHVWMAFGIPSAREIISASMYKVVGLPNYQYPWSIA